MLTTLGYEQEIDAIDGVFVNPMEIVMAKRVMRGSIACRTVQEGRVDVEAKIVRPRSVISCGSTGKMTLSRVCLSLNV